MKYFLASLIAVGLIGGMVTANIKEKREYLHSSKSFLPGSKSNADIPSCGSSANNVDSCDHYGEVDCNNYYTCVGSANIGCHSGDIAKKCFWDSDSTGCKAGSDECVCNW